jgi:hypothetical protein
MVDGLVVKLGWASNKPVAVALKKVEGCTLAFVVKWLGVRLRLHYHIDNPYHFATTGTGADTLVVQYIVHSLLHVVLIEALDNFDLLDAYMIGLEFVNTVAVDRMKYKAVEQAEGRGSDMLGFHTLSDDMGQQPPVFEPDMEQRLWQEGVEHLLMVDGWVSDHLQDSIVEWMLVEVGMEHIDCHTMRPDYCDAAEQGLMESVQPMLHSSKIVLPAFLLHLLP